MPEKNSLSSLVAVVIFAVAVPLLKVAAFSPSKQDIVDASVDEINGMVGKQVDEVTKVLGAKALDGEVQIEYEVAGVDELPIEAQRQIMNDVRGHLKSQKDLDAARRKGVDFSYVYKNEAGDIICHFTIRHKGSWWAF